VDDLNLEVHAGEIYALMGPDGAGKTTTMRLLSGILQPDMGSINLAGISLNDNPDAARAHIGYLAQSFSLYEDLTVLENIRFFAEVRGVSGADWRDRANEVLKFVDMEMFSGRLAGALSGGMKQKLALAVALVHNPPILLLDEPTGGVDPITRQAFWRLITRLLSSCWLLARRTYGRRRIAGRSRKRPCGKDAHVAGIPFTIVGTESSVATGG
jgi:ABC-2 type transport system ATP-binding protein